MPFKARGSDNALPCRWDADFDTTRSLIGFLTVVYNHLSLSTDLSLNHGHEISDCE